MLSIRNTTSLIDWILQCIRVHFWIILLFVLCAYSCLNTFYSCYIVQFNIFTLKSNKYTCICLWHLTTFPFCVPVLSLAQLICITDFMHPVHLPFLQSLTQWQLFLYKNGCLLVIPWTLYIKILILCDWTMKTGRQEKQATQFVSTSMGIWFEKISWKDSPWNTKSEREQSIWERDYTIILCFTGVKIF